MGRGWGGWKEDGGGWKEDGEGGRRMVCVVLGLEQAMCRMSSCELEQSGWCLLWATDRERETEKLTGMKDGDEGHG